MIYLLDTDIVVYMVRGLKPSQKPPQRRRGEALLRRCRQVQAAGDIVGLSTITVSELEFGARCSDQYETEIAAVHKILVPFDVYDFDSIWSPGHYGRIRHELEHQGEAIGAMDLLIAAHALTLEATLVSNNVGHFSRVRGLATTNWLSQGSTFG